MTDHTSLIARLESTGEGSRAIDWSIAHVVGESYEPEVCPAYSTSLDAALALAERVLPVMLWCVAKDDGHYRAWVASREDVVANPLRSFSAPTPALAVCVSILKALSTAGEAR